MERLLELTIRINEDDFEIEVYEPESGGFYRIQHPYSPDEHPEFDQAIGDEIYSWISMWKDECDD